MIIKQSVTNKKSVGKLILSALGLSVLLALSACSDDTVNESTNDTAAISKEDTIVVETSIVDTEAVVDEGVEPVNNTATTAIENTAPVIKADTAAPEVLAVDAGAKLYEVQCKVCHENGLLNAPKYGDTAAWSTRITKDRETLYMHSAQGFNKMPAQVNDNVSEAQVHAAVDYMLEAVS